MKIIEPSAAIIEDELFIEVNAVTTALSDAMWVALRDVEKRCACIRKDMMDESKERREG